MYFLLDEVFSHIKNDDKKIKHFFDTFGFVVIRKAITRCDFKLLLAEYDQQYAIRTGEPNALKMLKNALWLDGKKRFGIRYSLKKLFNRGTMRFLPNFVDGSEVYTNFFLSSRFQKIFKYFAGENWLYLGSDGSNFITTSFPWHRDWFTKVQILKFNVYYNPLPFFGGKFLIIPGSNFTDDTYAQLIQKCMSWPIQNKRKGGLSENGRLHQLSNPRDIFRKTRKGEITVPSIKLKINKGDIILFDQRAVHCVQNNFPKFQRRLMTLLLSKNAYDFSDSHPNLQNSSRSELMQEIVDLVVNERNHIGCDPYGNALLETSFTESNHFIKIEKSSNSDRFDKGSFKLKNGELLEFHLDLTKYNAIGRSYRDRINSGNLSDTQQRDKHSQDFSYEDAHLGINAQNIKNFEYE